MIEENMTLREIADAEGITPQSVAEIIERAIKKIRKALEEKGIKPDDLL